MCLIPSDNDYDNPDDVEIVTLGDAIYIRVKNDVALLLRSVLSLWEQQSTINPNMPIRGLTYFAQVYSKFIAKTGKSIYGKTLIRLPAPKYIVFYNGTEETGAVTKLRLSDAFMEEDKSGDFEWTATVYNLNRGKNDELLSKCKPLMEYMEFVNRVRDNRQQGKTLEEAVRTTVDSCINDGVMKEFLVTHKAEVMNVCITEFDEELYEKQIRAEGRAEGEIRGAVKTLYKIGFSIEAIATSENLFL